MKNYITLAKKKISKTRKERQVKKNLENKANIIKSISHLMSVVKGDPAKKLQKKIDAIVAEGIPEKVRARGVLLNPEILKEGDLILVHKKNPPLLSKWIIRVQRKMHGLEYAKWHHAMVFSGESINVIEAFAFKKVKRNAYWKYMDGSYDIKVRRVSEAGDSKKKAIVERAKKMAGKTYGWKNIAIIFLHHYRYESFKLNESNGLICSQLFAKSCDDEGIDLFQSTPLERVTPAHLAASTQLEDVDIEWVELSLEV